MTRCSHLEPAGGFITPLLTAAAILLAAAVAVLLSAWGLVHWGLV